MVVLVTCKNEEDLIPYKGTKTVEVTAYTNQNPLSISDGKMNLKFNTPQKMRKYISNVHKIGGTHLH